jgi:CsoR family transcriptional regulator, copper-sensing transcriptional repressor
LREGAKQTALTRLKRIEGQVGGLTRMIEDDRYCVDILTQISAVRAALHKVEEQVLRDHVAHCVADAFTSGDVLDQQQKVEELIGAIGRMTR